MFKFPGQTLDVGAALTGSGCLAGQWNLYALTNVALVVVIRLVVNVVSACRRLRSTNNSRRHREVVRALLERVLAALPASKLPPNGKWC